MPHEPEIEALLSNLNGANENVVDPTAPRRVPPSTSAPARPGSDRAAREAEIATNIAAYNETKKMGSKILRRSV